MFIFVVNKQQITMPNVIELNIKHYFERSGLLIPKTVNGIIPLKQLTELVIQYYHFQFEQIVK